ncbi:MAG: hypothetical protein K2N58_01000, partial [Treponemataceae bacterium]|nr:hypothetical protein [Treponemataceae bacterium]
MICDKFNFKKSYLRYKIRNLSQLAISKNRAADYFSEIFTSNSRSFFLPFRKKKFQSLRESAFLFIRVAPKVIEEKKRRQKEFRKI